MVIYKSFPDLIPKRQNAWNELFGSPLRKHQELVETKRRNSFIKIVAAVFNALFDGCILLCDYAISINCSS